MIKQKREFKKKKMGEIGFTLVELLVAIVLLGVGILALASLFPLSSHNVSQAGMNTKATAYVQEKIENLQNLTYNDPDLSEGTHSDTLNPIERIFTRTWTVTDDSPFSGCKYVRITVSWPDRGVTRSVQSVTIIAQAGR